MEMPTPPPTERPSVGSLLAAVLPRDARRRLWGTCRAPSATGGPTKVKVAYLGLTCEAAMFVAKEKGFFEEEGLDVEFVKTDWDGLRDGLGLGRFDANYTLIMYLLKPIEQGLDVKITGGVHSGCLRVQAGAKSSIQSVADLKGKRIGIPTMGSPPFLFASRVLAAQGMDPDEGRDLGGGRPGGHGAGPGEGAGRRGRRLRADRVDPGRAGEGPHDRRPGGRRALPRRILLRHGRQRQVRGEQSGRRPRR